MPSVVFKVLIGPLLRMIRDIPYPGICLGMGVRDGAELVLLCSGKILLFHKICLQAGFDSIQSRCV